MYRQQSANVLWNGETSKDFTIGNGVKQGGVLSQRLFCVYTDGLCYALRCVTIVTHSVDVCVRVSVCDCVLTIHCASVLYNHIVMLLT